MTELGPEWRVRYQGWLTSAQPLLEASQWTEAFQTYPWPRFDTAPWTPLKRPLSQSRVALVTSGGLSLAGQPSFDETHVEGDPTWRVIRERSPLTGWTIRHGHYDARQAEIDYNAVFPLDILEDLASEGIIGDVAPRHVSFVGFQPNAARFLGEMVPPMVEMFRQDAVDVVFLAPV